MISSREWVQPHLRTDAGDRTPDSRHSQTKRAICIAIIDEPILFKPRSTPTAENGQSSDEETGNSFLDTALLIFPPGSFESRQVEDVVSVLAYGEYTESCPKGKRSLLITRCCYSNIQTFLFFSSQTYCIFRQIYLLQEAAQETEKMRLSKF